MSETSHQKPTVDNRPPDEPEIRPITRDEFMFAMMANRSMVVDDLLQLNEKVTEMDVIRNRIEAAEQQGFVVRFFTDDETGSASYEIEAKKKAGLVP